MSLARAELAPAKVNLTLKVIGRRDDGYHDIESLVVFADFGDALRLTEGATFALRVRGPSATSAGAIADNLVLKASFALSERIPDLKFGSFQLTKRLPVAAGLGGGSSDAAAALRLLVRANGLALDDARVLAAARATGADVSVCLDPAPRVMRRTGDLLSAPLWVPRLAAVLANPGVAVPTKTVFEKLRAAATPAPPGRPAEEAVATDRAGYLAYLAAAKNDLEEPAIAIAPVIAELLAALHGLRGCRLARMSGSGATCFGIFDSRRAASLAAADLRKRHPDWWIRATTLG